MNKKKKDTPIDSKDLPQSEVYTRKEIYQHPQPADFGKPLNPKDNKSTTEEKTSKEAGLNEDKSTGEAGAFEGFENQENR